MEMIGAHPKKRTWWFNQTSLDLKSPRKEKPGGQKNASLDSKKKNIISQSQVVPNPKKIGEPLCVAYALRWRSGGDMWDGLT